jgi:hypothetical protein
MTEKMQKLAVAVEFWAQNLSERNADDRGQGALEYVGILLVVAVVITAALALDFSGFQDVVDKAIEGVTSL